MKKKEIKTISIISVIVFSIIFLSIGLILGSFNADYQNNKQINEEKKTNDFYENVKEICGDLEFNDTAYCLRDFINRNYNYHIMNEKETMGRDFTEIYENGGDCLDYSLLYSKLINIISYHDSKIIISLEDTHAYVQMSDWHGSTCILDLNHTPVCNIKETDEVSIFSTGSLRLTGDLNQEQGEVKG